MLPKRRRLLLVVGVLLMVCSVVASAYDATKTDEELIKAYEWVEVASWEVDSNGNMVENGMVLNADERLADGKWEIVEKAGKYGASMIRDPQHHVHLYFKIVDDILFDVEPGNLALFVIEYLDEGMLGPLGIQFDSHITTHAQQGAFSHKQFGTRMGTNQWKTGQVLCREVRFANRQHWGSDFRIWGEKTPFTVRKVTLYVVK